MDGLVHGDTFQNAGMDHGMILSFALFQAVCTPCCRMSGRLVALISPSWRPVNEKARHITMGGAHPERVPHKCVFTARGLWGALTVWSFIIHPGRKIPSIAN